MANSCSAPTTPNLDDSDFQRICPSCGGRMVKVHELTVSNHLHPVAWRDYPRGPKGFCPSQDCETVYASIQGWSARIGDLRVQVAEKSGHHDDAPACYCQNVTVGMIRECVENGADSLESVAEITNAGNDGDCRIVNPSGRCCKSRLRRLINSLTSSLNDGIDTD